MSETRKTSTPHDSDTGTTRRAASPRPPRLRKADPLAIVTDTPTLEGEAKAWKSVWSAGQGVGNVNDIPHAADLCRRLISEYRDAIGSAATDLFLGRES